MDCSLRKRRRNDKLEKRLWEAADQLRANSGLTAQQYSGPVLGLIFLRFAEVRFAKQRAALEKKASGNRRGSRVDESECLHCRRVIFLAPDARFDFLLKLPEGANIGSKLNDAMRAIERDNPQLAGVLPKTYELFTSSFLKQLLKRVSEIPATLDYDAFGRIYEYFLGEFAQTEGQHGRRILYARAASFDCSSKCSNHSTGACSIPPAGRAACSCRARVSSQSTRKIPRASCPFTARRKSARPSRFAG